MALAATTTKPAGPSSMATTQVAPTTVRGKQAKDAAVFKKGVPKQPVNFPPYEVTENHNVLSAVERQKLYEQHQNFKIFPSGGEDGHIRDYTRQIPYNSDKKTFHGRTGRGGFEREWPSSTLLSELY